MSEKTVRRVHSCPLTIESKVNFLDVKRTVTLRDSVK